MEKEFVPHNLALRLKSLGFDEYCFAFYCTEYNVIGFLRLNNSTCPENYIALPTFGQAFRWFDYSTDWSGFIVPSKEEGLFDWEIQNYVDPNYLSVQSDEYYTKREDAELACLEKLVELAEIGVE